VRLLAALLALAPGAALAHNGASSSAALTSPASAGEIADQSYTIAWTDANVRFGASVVTFDFRYTSAMPPTQEPGTIPPGITGGYVAVAIDELDPMNRLVWDTRLVPAGTYFVWAIPTEDPPDVPITRVTFSRGVVTVAHPGDPIHPAIVLPEPSQPFVRVFGRYPIAYEAFDSTGTASVAIAVSPRRDGTGFVPIAMGLPASAHGEVMWDLTGVAPGTWTLRAQISDARGLRFTAYARHFVEVVAVPASDAGMVEEADAAPREDAAPLVNADAAMRAEVPESCAATPSSPLTLLLFSGWVAALGRHRHAVRREHQPGPDHHRDPRDLVVVLDGDDAERGQRAAQRQS